MFNCGTKLTKAIPLTEWYICYLEQCFDYEISKNS